MSAHALRSSRALHSMKSSTSGWSALRMTIFAARRVFPPDLIAPANESNPRMNDTGPDAVPPPFRCSRDERSVDRLDPVPDPHLNSMPSVLASVRIESIESSTLLMKHAEHCGCSSTPTLNHTGELKLIFWWRRRCVSSAWNDCASASVAKYPPLRPQAEIVPATRPISCLTDRSRCGVPTIPRKYFCTTTFVAVWLQLFGISTSFCSK